LLVRSEEEGMGRVYVAVIGMLLAVQFGWAEGGAPVTVSSDGWTVTVEAEQATLSISRENLGTVLKEVQLNLGGEHGLLRLKGWSVERKGEKGLSIRTSEPRTAWVLELSPEALRISTTSTEGVLAAEAPAPPDRIVARLLDPQGVPVTWVGADEVKAIYGGSETRNPSFLPRRNPEVMNFALGQVTSSNLHSLFDRKTDTGIDFSEQTVMQRSRHEADLLEVMIPVPGNTQVRVIPDYFTKTLGLPFYVPFDDSYFPRPPAVWNSWDNYCGRVKEEDIVRNADWIADHLKSYGFEYVVLDEGYDGGMEDRDGAGTNHDWIGPWDPETFPHGPQWLTNHIKSKGLRAGLWIVPNASAGPVEEHPDWYLRYKRDGKIIPDYGTPTLDPTNPQVLDFVKKELTTLNEWGFDYYKIDGEHDYLKYVPGVDLDKIADKSVDPIVVYQNRLKLIRDTIGPKRFIEGCPAGTPLLGIGYFNSYFNGVDMYNSWQGQYALFSSINANAFLNHMVVYVMPGEGIEVGPPMSVEEAKKKRPRGVVEIARTHEDPLMGFGTTLSEARTLVSYVALTGVVYPVSSVMPELPEERVKLLKMTLPSMPILPVDLFSRGTDMPIWGLFKQTTPDYYIHNYPEILDLKVNAPSGIYDVAGLTNWRSWTTNRDLSFADKLGLSPEASYVVFDFWGQKLLGVFKGRMDVTIEPYDTRVLLIHPLVNHPQLVGTSRHITGAYSIKDLAWDGSKSRLRGSSETVPGDDYALWFYVPKGLSVSQVRAGTKANAVVPVQHELSGNSLKVSFPGQPEAVDWEVEFGGKSSK
jgi:hypothetical protein